MPGTVKLRSVKKFGKENDGYELSDEGKLFISTFFIFIFVVPYHKMYEMQT